MITTPQFAQAQIAYRQDQLKRDYERAVARPQRDRARHAVPAAARRLARATHAA